MSNITRRDFLGRSLAGISTALTVPHLFANNFSPPIPDFLGPVPLGHTDLKVTRIALGLGSGGWQYTSQQKKLGEARFLDLVQHAYDRGIRFLETADIYGTHELTGKSWKYIPREKVTLLTKIWTRPNEWVKIENAPTAVDRFRKELNTDKLDIVYVHCQVSENWEEETKALREDLSEMKQKGIIEAVGVSCHSYPALVQAAKSDWVEVVQVRINPFEVMMDNSSEQISALMKEMRTSGKGVIGMKIFGAGRTASDAQRQQSLEYVWKNDLVDSITLGLVNPAQVDDALMRVKGILD